MQTDIKDEKKENKRQKDDDGRCGRGGGKRKGEASEVRNHAKCCERTAQQSFAGESESVKRKIPQV